MKLSFFPTLMLRLPALPFNRQDANSKVPELRALLNNDAFMESIRVASSVLYEECLKVRETGTVDKDPKRTSKLIYTLVKYYNRMRSRCTPFGTFSAFGLLQWGERTDIITNNATWEKRLRPDMDFLCSLASQLQQDSAIRRSLRYFANSSLYKLGDEYRYYECYFEEQQKKYQISAVETSSLLDNLLLLCRERNGATFTELLTYICEAEDVPEDEAAGYLEALADNQVLVTDLTVQITAGDYLRQIMRVVEAADMGNMTVQLREISRLCADEGQDMISRLTALSTIMENMGIPCDRNKLFQVDSRVSLPDATLDQALREELAGAIQALHVLCSGRKGSPWLQGFKEKFAARYENRPVSLAEVTDPHTGIINTNDEGYVDYGDPCLNQLNQYSSSSSQHGGMPASIPDIIRDFLTEKLLYAYKHDVYTISLTDSDIQQRLAAALPVPQPLPDTFAVMFQVLADPLAHIFIESAGGNTGTSLLGRFARKDDDVHALLKEIDQFERNSHQDSILAGIVHLPEDRIGNVLLHPATRQYEIPYLALSAAPAEQQLPIDDLYLTLQQDTLQLYSHKLQKPVIPYIDNAHNYEYKTLPLYRLLGELQSGSRQKQLTFSWNIRLPGVHFYPRVQYKRIILSLARWEFSGEEFAGYQQLPEEERIRAFQLFCEKWKIPRFFLLAEADQTLLADREDDLTIHTFLSEAKNRETVILKESPDPAPIVKDAQHNIYAHQLITIAQAGPETAAGKAAPQVHTTAVLTRDFPPGTEWTYYKIYCNPGKANDMLCQLLLPLAEQLLEEQYTDSWFFIRYADPHPHLRIRFHLKDVSFAGQLKRMLYDQLREAFRERFIWKIQADTYNREIERYGLHTMTDVEQLFFSDSVFIGRVLQWQWQQPDATVLLLSALRYTDELLDMFGFTLPEKIAFSQIMQESFDKEFETNRPVKDILNRYFRNQTSRMQDWLQEGEDLSAYPALIELITWKQAHMAPVVKRIVERMSPSLRQSLPGSLIHMHFNRLFPVAQRRYEMIAYTLLNKYYKSWQARKPKETV
ncbi:lantibiotic dehydratase [Chitinophaga tropicalis]|uniref:Lantibiotic dehydratase n=1 Tax=Chitinophaga tropicalis TaxID=2683588 RepID=A0A7K1U614_9BACT|nr:lantibiotic dehydratase [Chitinophaga tropicalis]MVT09790.1 hypothetical protein [Chitinophaga tropicalis]